MKRNFALCDAINQGIVMGLESKLQNRASVQLEDMVMQEGFGMIFSLTHIQVFVMVLPGVARLFVLKSNLVLTALSMSPQKVCLVRLQRAGINSSQMKNKLR